MKFKDSQYCLPEVLLASCFVLSNLHTSQGFPLQSSITKEFVREVLSAQQLSSKLIESQLYADVISASEFNTRFEEEVAIIHKQIDEVNQIIVAMEDEELRNLSKSSADQDEELEDISVNTNESILDLELDQDSEIDELSRNNSILENQAERLKSLVTINRFFLNKQMRVNKQKYAKKRLQIKDIVADFMGTISAAKKLPIPTETAAGALDVADNILRLGFKMPDFIKGISDTVDELMGE